MTVAIFRQSLPTRLTKAVRALFTAGEQGAWFDPSDITSMFQDSAGTTPAVVGQPVGLLLDKSKGLVLGPDVVVNGNFSLGTGWVLQAGWSIAGGSANASNASAYFYQGNGLIIAKEVYSVTYTVSGYVSGTIKAYVGATPTLGNPVSADGTYTAYICSAINGNELGFLGTGFTGSVDNVIVKKVLGNHATQSTAAARPTYQTTPTRITLDKVDDSVSLTVPTGGFVGTMVLSTTQGTAAYGVNIPAGTHTIGGLYFPGPDIVGEMYRHGALTDAEIANVSAYMVSKGGGPAGSGAYAGVTSFASYWRDMNRLTSMPMVDSSAVTNMLYAWYGCSSLTSFPLLNTAAVTSMFGTWRNCLSLTTFPLLNTSAVTTMGQAWYDCVSLTSFPLLNTAAVTDINAAWYGCSSLTSFPLLNTSAATNLVNTWAKCSALTSFPSINTSAATNMLYAWYSCSSLTSFPLLNTAAVTDMSYAWRACTNLAIFPANMFDACPATSFIDAFIGCALTQTSVDNILISINTANTSNGTLNMTGGTSATPGAAGLAAKAALEGRGWTVTVNP